MLKYILIVYAFINLVAFILYFADKQKAKKNKWRIKESTLLGIGFFGGAIGALISMNLFRHKTKHWYFWAVNFLGLLVQFTAFGIYIYYTG